MKDNAVSDGTCRATVRERLLRVARFIDSKTPFLNKVKNRLGIYRLATSALVRDVTPEDVRSIKKQLSQSVVVDQVSEIKRQFGDAVTIDYYVLFIEKMGDVMACEPFVGYLKTLSQNSRIHWLIKPSFKELLMYDKRIDEIIEMPSIAAAYDYCETKRGCKHSVIVNCLFDGAVCSVTGRVLRNENNPEVTAFNYYAIGTLQEAYSYVAGLKVLSMQPQFHFASGLEVPNAFGERYVVFHCQSDDPNRNWDELKWNRLANELLSAGYHVVEIGAKKTIESVSPFFHDYTGLRSLQQLAWIIKNAVLFVGIDSGFAHFANATSTRSVVLLGRYKNFPVYNPFCGSFANTSFHLVRAEVGEAASTITEESVKDSVMATLGSIQST